MAPALAPRVVPLLARHVAAAAPKRRPGWPAQRDAPVNLLAAMQLLALEIAGRSMFSIEMGELRAADAPAAGRVRPCGTGRPHLLDMLLPALDIAPRDFARRRFQRALDGVHRTAS